MLPSIRVQVYSKEAKAAHDSLSKSTQMLQSARTELLRYMHSSSAGPQPSRAIDEPEEYSMAEAHEQEAMTLTNRRYDCGCAFVLQVLSMLEGLTALSWVRAALLERSFASELLNSNLCNMPRKIQHQAIVLLCYLSAGSAEATRAISKVWEANRPLSTHLCHLPIPRCPFTPIPT